MPQEDWNWYSWGLLFLPKPLRRKKLHLPRAKAWIEKGLTPKKFNFAST
jgi:hypothetical protein